MMNLLLYHQIQKYSNSYFKKKPLKWYSADKDDPPPPGDDENKEKLAIDIPVWDQEVMKVH